MYGQQTPAGPSRHVAMGSAWTPLVEDPSDSEPEQPSSRLVTEQRKRKRALPSDDELSPRRSKVSRSPHAKDMSSTPRRTSSVATPSTARPGVGATQSGPAGGRSPPIGDSHRRNLALVSNSGGGVTNRPAKQAGQMLNGSSSQASQSLEERRRAGWIAIPPVDAEPTERRPAAVRPSFNDPPLDDLSSIWSNHPSHWQARPGAKAINHTAPSIKGKNHSLISDSDESLPDMEEATRPVDKGKGVARQVAEPVPKKAKEKAKEKGRQSVAAALPKSASTLAMHSSTTPARRHNASEDVIDLTNDSDEDVPKPPVKQAEVEVIEIMSSDEDDVPSRKATNISGRPPATSTGSRRASGIGHDSMQSAVSERTFAPLCGDSLLDNKSDRQGLPIPALQESSSVPSQPTRRSPVLAASIFSNQAGHSSSPVLCSSLPEATPLVRTLTESRGDAVPPAMTSSPAADVGNSLLNTPTPEAHPASPALTPPHSRSPSEASSFVDRELVEDWLIEDDVPPTSAEVEVPPSPTRLSPELGETPEPQTANFGETIPEATFRTDDLMQATRSLSISPHMKRTAVHPSAPNTGSPPPHSSPFDHSSPSDVSTVKAPPFRTPRKGIQSLRKKVRKPKNGEELGRIGKGAFDETEVMRGTSGVPKSIKEVTPPPPTLSSHTCTPGRLPFSSQDMLPTGPYPTLALQNAMLALPNHALKQPHVRRIFESHIRDATALDEPHAPFIDVINDVDSDACPPWEFTYTNKLIYREGVPPPDRKALQGCDCIGPCDPRSETCACVRRQAHFMQDDLTGFIHGKDGRLRSDVSPNVIMECNDACECSTECRNRVIQHGRKVHIQLVKTPLKGWGVFAGKPIPKGSFLGIYSGELLTDDAAEERGIQYNRIGRTYLFNLDFYYLKDKKQAAEAVSGVSEMPAESTANGELESSQEHLYAVDAFHYGNFTRFLNHSCEPNCAIHAAYVNEADIQKPTLVLYTNRDVAKGEELCFSYSGDADDSDDEDDESSAHKSVAVYQNESVDTRCYCGTESCKGRMFR